MKGERYGSIWKNRIDFECFELVAHTFGEYMGGAAPTVTTRPECLKTLAGVGAVDGPAPAEG